MATVTNLSDPAFWALFKGFKESAFRLETLQEYDVSYEEGPFRDFLDGKSRYTSQDQEEYAALVSTSLANGKSMSRVHIVKQPLSDYARFELTWPYVDSTAAGENIRIIPVNSDEWPSGLPHQDFWLFDDRIAAIMRYDSTGKFIQADITEDEAKVAQCVEWKQKALDLSVSYSEFMRGLSPQ